jgi:hypothetical protein
MKQEQDNGLTGFFVIVIIISALIYSIRKDIQDLWNSITSTFKTITNFITSQLFFVILAIIVLTILVYFTIRLIKTIKRKREERKTKTEEINKEAREIGKILDEDLDMDPEELSKFIEKIKEKIKVCKTYSHEELLEEKLKMAKKYLQDFKHGKRVEEMKQERSELEKDLEEMRRKKEQEEQDKEAILKKLDINENRVFKKSDLRDKEIEALKEEGFEQVNQFDVLERKFISILIKPYEKLNHSREHIFLVWGVIKLLKKLGIKEIKEHKSFDADITFKHEGKWFALEIEIGSLLRKHKQLQEKLNYLNKKYPKKWLFIVSNKKLLSKYRKYGLSTSRKDIEENLKKLMKNA